MKRCRSRFLLCLPSARFEPNFLKRIENSSKRRTTANTGFHWCQLLSKEIDRGREGGGGGGGWSYVMKMHSFVLFCSVPFHTHLYIKINGSISLNLLEVWVHVCVRWRVSIHFSFYFLLLFLPCSLGKGYSKSFLFLVQDRKYRKGSEYTHNIENIQKKNEGKYIYILQWRTNWLCIEKGKKREALHTSSLTVRIDNVRYFSFISYSPLCSENL